MKNAVNKFLAIGSWSQFTFWHNHHQPLRGWAFLSRIAGLHLLKRKKMMLLVPIYLFLSHYRLLYLHKCTEKDGDREAWGLYRVQAPPRLVCVAWWHWKRLCSRLQWYRHSIPKTLVIWVSPVTLNQIAKVIWEGDAYITKVWEWGWPKRGDAHITVLNIRLKEEERRDFTKSTTDC